MPAAEAVAKKVMMPKSPSRERIQARAVQWVCVRPAHHAPRGRKRASSGSIQPQAKGRGPRRKLSKVGRSKPGYAVAAAMQKNAVAR